MRDETHQTSLPQYDAKLLRLPSGMISIMRFALRQDEALVGHLCHHSVSRDIGTLKD